MAERAWRPWTLTDPAQAAALLRRRHPDFEEMFYLVNWIIDTLESGRQYRRAEYGGEPPFDVTGNLIRHRREWALPGDVAGGDLGEWFWGARGPDESALGALSEYNRAAQENFATRLLRTPTPQKLRHVVTTILSKIYYGGPKRTIRGIERREGDAALTPPPRDATPLDRLYDWWRDVDGRGTEFTRWMKEEVAPLLLAIGFIDIYVDHPGPNTREIIDESTEDYALPTTPEEYAEAIARGARPAPVTSMADVDAGGLSAAIGQYILPHHVLWYRLDDTGKDYTEILIAEWHTHLTESTGLCRYLPRFRYWNTRGWTVYAGDGTALDDGAHPYGRVPIKRVFDRRHYRLPHAGDSRLMGVVERCRESYNEESALIFAMDLQCFSLLQAPPTPGDRKGQAVPVGPGMTVFKVPGPDGTSLEGYEYVSPTMSPLEFMRQRLADLDDQMDREAGLTRPAGALADSGKHVAQAGISKAFDQEEGNNLLSSVAESLQQAERDTSELVLTVLANRRPTREELRQFEILYPRQFNLLQFDDLAKIVPIYQLTRDSCGYIPSLEKDMLRQFADLMDPSRTQERKDLIGKEIDKYVDWMYSILGEAKVPPNPQVMRGPNYAGVAGPGVNGMPAAKTAATAAAGSNGSSGANGDGRRAGE